MVRAFNERLALVIVRVVSSMWCAYAFTALALVSLPAAIRSGQLIILVGWVAQTFLQLILLSIILAGQDIQGRKSEQVSRETHDGVMTELAELKDLHLDLHALLNEGKR